MSRGYKHCNGYCSTDRAGRSVETSALTAFIVPPRTHAEQHKINQELIELEYLQQDLRTFVVRNRVYACGVGFVCAFLAIATFRHRRQEISRIETHEFYA